MMNRSPGLNALYLRDYFFLQNCPAEGDEAVWRKVECAAIRIAESVGPMLGDYSHETRLRAAKRVRRAARECVRHIPGLRGVEPWPLALAVYFESLAETALEDLAKEPPDGRTLQH